MRAARVDAIFRHLRGPTIDLTSSSGGGTLIDELRTPCCVVDHAVASANGAKMLARCAKLGCKLRPHVKSHKTVEGALLQTGGVRERIVVSTLAEAAFFADAGFDDILYAVPLTPDKVPQAAALSAALRKFQVMVDHEVQFDALVAHGSPDPASQARWAVCLMVDYGYHRDGVDPATAESLALCQKIAACGCARLCSLYTHGGHSYDGGVAAAGEAERDALLLLKGRLQAAGVDCAGLTLGVGSTPTCSQPPAHLEGIDEMHPGNYIINDAMQVALGSCAPGDVAVRILTRVLGHYPATNMLLIDLGWTGASAQGSDEGYGYFDGHPELKIATLKQEAGEVESATGAPIEFSKFPIGSILQLVPFHSCASSAAHNKMHVLRDGVVAGQWSTIRASRFDGW